MIHINNPLLVLLVFVVFVLVGTDLLVHMNDWTRRIGKFVLWWRKTRMGHNTLGGEYFDSKARKAMEQPEQAMSYRAILLLTGVVSLGISLCSLVGLLAFLLGASR